jgi:hypothetical protein
VSHVCGCMFHFIDFVLHVAGAFPLEQRAHPQEFTLLRFCLGCSDEGRGGAVAGKTVLGPSSA